MAVGEDRLTALMDPRGMALPARTCEPCSPIVDYLVIPQSFGMDCTWSSRWLGLVIVRK